MQKFRASPLWRKLIAGFLAAILLAFAIPEPANAAIDAAAICAFLGIGIGAASTAGGTATGIIASGVAATPFVVPVFDWWTASEAALQVPFAANTSIQETAATQKTCWDAITTAVLKTVINLVRDMTIRWISTGRFEGPVISAGYSVDIAKSAENASRTFLGRITGLNLCGDFGIPGVPAFSFNINLGLSCSATDNRQQRFIDPALYSKYDRYVDSLPVNDYPQTLVRLAQAKAEAEMRAVAEKSADFMSGSGFLGTRDSKGNIITPGSAIAKLVMEQAIVSPIRQTDVANTTQQAIAAIIDTAIRTLLEKGISAVSGG